MRKSGPRLGTTAGLLILSAAVAGCDDGRVRPPPAMVRVVHAAPTTSTIEFLRAERPAASVDYGTSSDALSFDTDRYRFHIQVPDPATGGTRRIASFEHELAPNQDHLFVLTEIADAVEPIVVEKPPFAEASNAEILAVHAAPAVGGVDLYFEPAGTDVAAATPFGSMTFADVLEPATRAPGEYRLTLTEPGRPADVLLRSPPLTLQAGESVAYVLAEGSGDGIVPLVVIAAGSQSGLLIDEDTQSGLTVVNAAADQTARDVYLDEDFGAPVVGGVAFGAASDLVIVPPGARTVSVTPAGSPGVVEAEAALGAQQGRRHIQLIAGEPGGLAIAGDVDRTRRIRGEARIRFMNGASQFTPLEFFVVTPGTDVTGHIAQFVLDTPGFSSRLALPPGDYELLIRDPDTATLVAGPQPVTLSEGIFTVLTVNGATPGTVDTVLLEDFESP